MCFQASFAMSDQINTRCTFKHAAFNTSFHEKFAHRGRPKTRLQYFEAANNLGALSPLAWPTSTLDFDPTTALRHSSLDTSAIVIDWSAIVASGTLLLILLYFAFDRILGLDRVFMAWAQDWKLKAQLRRRSDMMAARERLEKKFREGDE